MKKVYQFFIIILFCSALFNGCAAPRYNLYMIDAWTGEKFLLDYDHGQGWSTQEEYASWVETVVIRDDEGHVFKNLRNKVAYEAAKGIKEQRTRIITGE